LDALDALDPWLVSEKMHYQNTVQVAWPWTPLTPELLYVPGTRFRVNVSAHLPNENLALAMLTAHQRSRVEHDMDDRQGYPMSLWRASLAEPVVATFQSWSKEPVAIGILQNWPTFPPMVVTGAVSFDPVGGRHLPPELQVSNLVLSFVFVACCASILMLRVYTLRFKDCRSRLHLAFLGCFLLKFLTLLLQLVELIDSDVTGYPSFFREISAVVLKHVQDICIMGVFFLIGVGWKITRQHLRSSEWIFALVAMAIGFLLRMMSFLCGLLGACNPIRYKLTVFTVNALCSLVIIVATNFNIFVLTRQLQESHVSSEASWIYAKFYAYMRFRICYLYYIMLEVACDAAMRLFREPIVQVMKEVVEWLLLTVVLWVWRPGYMEEYKVFDLACASDVPSSDSEEPLGAPED